jgi:hypothetical protein
MPNIPTAVTIVYPTDTELSDAGRADLRARMGIDPGLNNIGAEGLAGFGVGICPSLPAGFTGLPGYQDPLSSNYGNYIFTDGSVMVWVPAFYYRIGHASNPGFARWALNSIDVLPYSAFADVATANVAGYALHRAFYNAGAIQAGVFVDKYQCSNNSGTASSLRYGNPLSTNAAHNPIGALTGAPANNYGGVLAAAKTRGSRFFAATRFVHAALAMLATAHGQAAASAGPCAWWKSTGNVGPRGCNNNALGDSDESLVKYQSDGYSNCGKTGSGSPLAMVTHNGQDCGIADVNGNMLQVSWGVTCITTAKSITGVGLTNPLMLTVVSHGTTTGKEVQIQSLAGSTQLNDKIYRVTVIDANTISLDGVNGTSGIGAWTSGGTATFGNFYVVSEDADVAALTGGASLATDAWGITGITAHSVAISPYWRTDYPNNGFVQQLGNTTQQVFAANVSGGNWRRTGAGMIASDLAVAASGAAVFGQDYHYQHIRNDLCPVAAGDWNNGVSAGPWAAIWSNARGDSLAYVGFRAASYL